MNAGDRVLVLFAVAADAIDPAGNDDSKNVLFTTRAAPVWKERRILSVRLDNALVLDYHLREIEVPLAWLRPVPPA